MMKKVNFDDYSSNYNEIMQQQHAKYGDIEYYSEYKVRILKDLLESQKSLKILEFGCGIGRNLKYIQKYLPNADVYAYDISEESLAIAKKENKNVTILNNPSEKEAYFDVIFIAGVYHHIATHLRDEVTKTIQRLLKYAGKVIIFEHNPYNPVTRHMVNTCEFDKDAVLLTKKDLVKIFIKNGFKYQEGKYSLFVPPKLSKFDFIEKYISWIPLGGQYYIVMFK